MMTDDRWNEVGAAIRARMRELGLAQADLTRLSGISAFTIRKLQNGVASNYRPPNLAKVSLALGWTADSIQRILDGQPPVESTGRTASPSEPPTLERIADRLTTIEQRLTTVEEQITSYDARDEA